ncbi:MAG: amidohydrolase [Acidobacteriia bacterium]|nr:amidohydrolase [Terriglobia bacterium]
MLLSLLVAPAPRSFVAIFGKFARELDSGNRRRADQTSDQCCRRHGCPFSFFFSDSWIGGGWRHVFELGQLMDALGESDSFFGATKAWMTRSYRPCPGTDIAEQNGRAVGDDPRVFPVLEAARDLGAALFVHPWDVLGRERMPRYWLPWLVGMPAETCLAICSVIFGGVLDRLPGLRIGFAHGGGSFPGTFGRIERGFEARPDLCAVGTSRPPRDFLGRFYVDSLVHDPTALRTLLDLVGRDRVALGSDYPFPLGEPVPGRLVESMPDLDAETKGRILGENALEFLGLDPVRERFRVARSATP